MTYQIPYEADYLCPKGHQFVADAAPFGDQPKTCPKCYEDWVRMNIGAAFPISPPRPAKVTVVPL